MTYELNLNFNGKFPTFAAAVAFRDARLDGLELACFSIYKSGEQVSVPNEAAEPAPKPRAAKKPEVAVDPKPTVAATAPASSASAPAQASAQPSVAVVSPTPDATVADAAALRSEVREIAKTKMDASAENKVAVKALLTKAGVDSLGKLPDAALAAFKAGVEAL